MKHVFLDVEAFGPPGTGHPFALGAVTFDARGVLERRQWSIKREQRVCGDSSTLEWLSKQAPEVLAQMRGGEPFRHVWREFVSWVNSPFDSTGQIDLSPITFWADDWSDFAWLDIAARECGVTPLRDLGSQLDSSAITRLAHKGSPLAVHSTRLLTAHMAVDDAEYGALELLTALRVLGQEIGG